MGDALFRLKRYGEAASSMKRALELEPDHPEAFNISVLIGRAFDEMGRRDESEEYYRRAVEINPDAADTFHGKAESLRDNGHHEESLRWYRAAIKANPDSAQSYAAMGDALFRLKRYGEAVSSMKRALEIRPDIASPEVLHFLIGKASEELGRAGEAEKGYRSALDAAPGFFSEAFDALVQLYFSQKRYEETIELYRELLSAEPENVAAHSGIAAAMINMGRSEEAIGMLERALSLDETDAETHAKMGVALINLGRLEESLASFKRALSLDPAMKSAPGKPPTWQSGCCGAGASNSRGAAVRDVSSDARYLPVRQTVVLTVSTWFPRGVSCGRSWRFSARPPSRGRLTGRVRSF